MTVMFDGNVALDAFQQREPHHLASAFVLSKSLQGEVQGSFPAHVATTIYYILRKSLGKQQAMDTTRWLIQSFAISPCDGQTLSVAADLGLSDFEDAVVAQSAARDGCDYIVTRNKPDFAGSRVVAITPSELLDVLAKSN